MRPISSWLVVALLFAATCDAARHEPEHPNRARHSTAAAGVGEKHSPSAPPKHAGGFPARHDPIEIQPGDGKTIGVIIFIHGLGGSPEKYTWLANDGSKNYARPGVKWIFPWSPELDVAVTQKREPAWFDMNDFHIGHLTDDRAHITSYNKPPAASTSFRDPYIECIKVIKLYLHLSYTEKVIIIFLNLI